MRLERLPGAGDRRANTTNCRPPCLCVPLSDFPEGRGWSDLYPYVHSPRRDFIEVFTQVLWFI